MRNLLETAVRETYDALRVNHSEYCACEMCQSDVLAYALNGLRPRYSGGTDAGFALISVDLQKDQTRATLAVAVLDAMRRVAATPRHPPAPAPPRS